MQERFSCDSGAYRLLCLLAVVQIVPGLLRGATARLHPEQPAYPIHLADHKQIHAQCQCQRECADDQPLGQDTQIPLHRVERDHDDYWLL